MVLEFLKNLFICIKDTQVHSTYKKNPILNIRIHFETLTLQIFKIQYKVHVFEVKSNCLKFQYFSAI